MNLCAIRLTVRVATGKEGQKGNEGHQHPNLMGPQIGAGH
ncbi:uncharacterized protein METZ01_LOCUS321286 [marine metagenome]|uniref:Uncharacterized protein n=1 Tax=marine metagenome TaxID=408172 RepID=A0A382P941_9ZZZZ